MAKGDKRYKITWYKPVWVKGELKKPGDVVVLDDVEFADMNRKEQHGDKVYNMIEPVGPEKKAK